MTIMLTVDETAARLHLKPSTLKTMRKKGGGPDYVKTGYRTVVYRLADVEAWEKSRTFSNTQQEKAQRE